MRCPVAISMSPARQAHRSRSRGVGSDGSHSGRPRGAHARVKIEDIGGGRTRMSIDSAFPSTEAMEKLLAMGMEEGLKQAVGQIDAILQEAA